MHRILAMVEREMRRFRRSPTLIVVSMVWAPEAMADAISRTRTAGTP